MMIDAKDHLHTLIICVRFDCLPDGGSHLGAFTDVRGRRVLNDFRTGGGLLATGLGPRRRSADSDGALADPESEATLIAGGCGL